MTQFIKPREYGEPIHPDAPGFNPTVHKDLVTEVNEALAEFQIRKAVGPADASSDEYDYRKAGDDLIEYYDREQQVWRPLATFTDTYKPGWIARVSVTSPTSNNRVYRSSVEIVTDQAQWDGRDFRMFRLNSDGTLGERLACYVPAVADAGSLGFKYTLHWANYVPAGQTIEVAVTWGDPKAQIPQYTAAELEAISSLGGDLLGACRITPGSRDKYKPGDDSTAGTSLYVNRDDSANTFVIPYSGKVVFNDISYQTLGLNPNGAIEFGETTAGRPTSANNALIWAGNGDLYEKSIRYEDLVDGGCFIIDTGAPGFAGGFKLTVRHFNYGRWLMTLYHNSTPWPSQLAVRINGVLKVYNAPMAPKESDPSTWYSVEVDTGFLKGEVIGNVEPVAGQRLLDAGGLRPIYASSVKTPSSNVQDELSRLSDELRAISTSAPASSREDFAWFLGGH